VTEPGVRVRARDHDDVSRAELRALLCEIVERLRRHPRVRYGEVRFTDERVEQLRVRDAGLASARTRRDHAGASRSRGVGIRVLGERTWGFATSASLAPAAIRAAADRAVAIAAASSSIAKRVTPFEPALAQRGRYATRVAVDPFAIDAEARLAVLDRAVGRMLEGKDGAQLRSADARMEWRRLSKLLVTTEGTDVEQDFVLGAAGIQAVSSGSTGDTQIRSYPTWSGGHAFQGGYERMTELDLEGEAPRVTSEAVALLSAPPCPEGERDLVLESSQVALQVHESCGHPTELDRALGTEITLAGGSFLSPSMLGSFRYGSEQVTLTCDALEEGGLGTFGWDDEGTPAARHTLVDRGVFVDYLSGRDTAAAIGRRSTGTVRASGWDRVPLIRMTNVSLAPGQAGTLEDLVGDTDDGIYMATDRSWSIDDQRLDFQFSCELAWEIKRGKRVRLLRHPVYAGTTPRFWASCDAVCGKSDYRLWGLAVCGKGEPMQMIGVGHGAAPARFRGVRVGSTG